MIQEICTKHEYVETVFTASNIPTSVKAIVCRKCGILLQTEKTEIVGEWQLCPKCHGDGHLGRYNSPNTSSNACPQCDVCFGAKIIIKPLAKSTE